MRTLVLALAVLALSGCVDSSAEATVLDAASTSQNSHTWTLERCKIFGISHFLDRDYVDGLLPPGLVPGDAADFFFPAGDLMTGHTMAGIIGFDCFDEATSTLAGFVAMGALIERPGALPELPAALVDSHWMFGHSTSAGLTQWMGDAGVPMGAADDVHVVTGIEADVPPTAVAVDTIRSTQVFVRLGAQSFHANTMGGLATDADGRDAPVMLRIWQPVEDGLRTLEVQFVNRGAMGSMACEHEGVDPYAHAIGRQNCNEGALGFAYGEQPVHLTATHYPGVTL